MASFQKLKLSLTWRRVIYAIIRNNAKTLAVNSLPPILGATVETESEIWNNLTSGQWRLHWSLVAAMSVAAPAIEYGQKSLRNVFIRSYSQYSGWSSSSVVVVAVLVVIIVVALIVGAIILSRTTRAVSHTTTFVTSNLRVHANHIFFYHFFSTLECIIQKLTFLIRILFTNYGIAISSTFNRIRERELLNSILLAPCSQQCNGKATQTVACTQQSGSAVYFTHHPLLLQSKSAYNLRRGFGNCAKFLLLWILLSVLCLCAAAYQTEKVVQNASSYVTHPTITTLPSIQRLPVAGAPKLNGLKEDDAKSHETPRYMLKMHERHKRDWLDYGQFEDNCMTHPMHWKTKLTSGSVGGVKRLGAVTAIRHHKHIETRESHPNYSSQLLSQKRRSIQLASTHRPTEHRLLFRLADMPPNEQLLAASIRLRYEPGEHKSRVKERQLYKQCHSSTRNHQWPIVIWLQYYQPYQKARFDAQTVGWFEPDVTLCFQSVHISNKRLLHLPAGWFNVPLSQTVLEMLKNVNAMPSEGPKFISLRILSVTSKLHVNESGGDRLKLTRNGLNDHLIGDWVHEAPHLITFHRDPKVVEHVKRTRRSLPDPVAKVSSNTVSRVPNIAENKKPEANTFGEMQRRPRSAVYQEYKSRAKRRAVRQRRPGRHSRGYWGTNDMARKQSRYQYYGEEESDRNENSENMYGGNARKVEEYPDEYENNIVQTDISSNSPNYLETVCQRRELIIDFAAVGWSGWVIAPRTYNARQCRGHCPFPLSTHYNTTNHAILLQLVHLLDAARISGPCCVPNQLSSQSLLYHSQKGDVVLRVYEDMVVESCACR